jgi:hypothetical protein
MAPGKEAQLRLEVALPGRENGFADRGRGTSVTVLDQDELADYHDRPVWLAIQQLVPYHQDRSPFGTSLRSTRSATLRSAEPLLIMDGTRMIGDVHRVLNGVSAAEVSRVEIHRGAVSGWEYGHGAENGVIVLTTRVGPVAVSAQAPETCVRMD